MSQNKHGVSSFNRKTVMKHKIDHNEFVNWMINDREDLISLGEDVRNALLSNGVFTIRSEDLLNEAAYISESLLNFKITEDVATFECELINVPVQEIEEEEPSLIITKADFLMCYECTEEEANQAVDLLNNNEYVAEQINWGIQEAANELGLKVKTHGK